MSSTAPSRPQVALLGGSMALALGGTVVAPALLIALLPASLGIPHLASELRCLVRRRLMERPVAVLAAAASAALVAVRACEVWLGANALWPIESVAVAAWIAGTVLVVAPRDLLLRGAALAGAVLVLAAGPLLRGAVAFMHPAITLVVWLTLARADRRAAWLACLAALAAILLVCVGAFDSLLGAADGGAAFGLDLDDVAHQLFPLLGETAGRRAVVASGFAQAVHYAVWLVWVPGALGASPAPREWMRDLGRAGVAAAVAGMFVLAAATAVDLAAARSVYLSLASFHAYAELALLLALAARRRQGR